MEFGDEPRPVIVFLSIWETPFRFQRNYLQLGSGLGFMVMLRVRVQMNYNCVFRGLGSGFTVLGQFEEELQGVMDC